MGRVSTSPVIADAVVGVGRNCGEIADTVVGVGRHDHESFLRTV